MAVKIEGNPNNPDNQGRICGRANAGLMTLYNPYRPKAPMKRTNPEKGTDVDPKWVEITWDEALNAVAAKLKQIKQTDPRKLVVLYGHRGWDVSLAPDFFAAIGTPTRDISNCVSMVMHPHSEWMLGSFFMEADRLYSKYMLTLGRGVFSINKATPATTRELLNAKDRGMRTVAVAPYLSPSDVKADEWVPIKPSTDIAFTLAIANVVLNELNTYDVECVKYHTNGPYLITPDGWYARSKKPEEQAVDLVRKQSLGKPYIWDAVDKKAKVYDDPTIKDFALEGTYILEGVQCKPAMQVLKEHFAKFGPEWAEKITDVPAGTIRRLARELVDAAQIGSTIVINGVTMPYRPACYTAVGHGPSVNRNGFDVHGAEQIVSACLGTLNVPGGQRSMGVPAYKINPADGLLPAGSTSAYGTMVFPPQRADIQDMNPQAYKTMHLFWDATLNPSKYYLDYKVEALGIIGCNPVGGGADTASVREVLRKIPFSFAIPYHFDEPVEHTDIVLPEHSFLERYAVIQSSNSIEPWIGNALRQPVLQSTVYNTMESNDIVIELAERMGVLYGKGGLNSRINTKYALKGNYALDLNKKYKWTEILDRAFRSAYGDNTSLESMKRTALIGRPTSVKESYGTPQNPKWRVGIYREYFKWVGEKLKSDLKNAGVSRLPPYDNLEDVFDYFDPLPRMRPFSEPNSPPEYDLIAIHAKTLLQASMATQMDNPWIAEDILLFDPWSMMVVINTETAKRKGLKDADNVIVESKYGKTQGLVKTSELVRPDTVALSGCFGARSVDMNPIARLGPNINDLLPIAQEGGLYTIPPTGGITNRIPVKVYKA